MEFQVCFLSSPQLQEEEEVVAEEEEHEEEAAASQPGPKFNVPQALRYCVHYTTLHDWSI